MGGVSEELVFEPVNILEAGGQFPLPLSSFFAGNFPLLFHRAIPNKAGYYNNSYNGVENVVLDGLPPRWKDGHSKRSSS